VTETAGGQRASRSARRVLERTRRALAFAAGRRDGRLAFAAGTLAYLLVYMVASGSLAVRRGLGFDVVLARDPLSKLLARTGPVSFEPLALVDVYGARLLLAPATSSSVAYSPRSSARTSHSPTSSVAQPKACGIDTGAGSSPPPRLLSGRRAVARSS